jgi:hypothetical protein
MKFVNILSFVLLIYLCGCREIPPVVSDGNGTIELKAVWNNSTDTIPNIVPLQNAKVILSSQYGMQIFYTGQDGTLILNHLPTAVYNVSVKAYHPQDHSIVLVGAVRDLNIGSGQISKPTITAKPVSSSGISINEIYCVGPVNSIFYFYDLFLELYNSSDSIKYVDGMQIMRVSRPDASGDLKPGADWYNDGRMQGVTWIYKFPGRAGEKNYPFYPKQFLVLAGDAVDHRKTVSNSIDLTYADWEFYNQYMAADLNNPNVPDLINLQPDVGNKFLIRLTSDIVAIASGVDSIWTDGIDISTIIDAVQYASDPTTQKTIDDRLDRGLAPNPPRYSGKSMQRKEPGMDTNDGSLDWEIIPSPTPGRQ